MAVVKDSGTVGSYSAAAKQQAAKTNAAQQAAKTNAAQTKTVNEKSTSSGDYFASIKNAPAKVTNALLTGGELYAGVARDNKAADTTDTTSTTTAAEDAYAARKAMEQWRAGTETTPTTATYIDAAGEAKKAEVVPTAKQLEEQKNAEDKKAAKDKVEKAQETIAEQEDAMSYLDSVKATYQDMYDKAVASNNEAAAANIAQVMEQIEASKTSLKQQYKETNKELYRGYMEVLRTTPQTLASMGYTGGMSESSRIGIDTGYQEALAQNERERLAAENDLDLQASQSTYEANAAAASANAEALQNLYSNQVNLLLQEQQDKVSRAETLAAYGDFSGYKALGYSDAEIAAMAATWKKLNADALESGTTKTTSSSSSGSGSSSSSSAAKNKSTGSYALGNLLKASSNGYNSSQILDALKKDGVQITDAVKADVAWARSK